MLQKTPAGDVCDEQEHWKCLSLVILFNSSVRYQRGCGTPALKRVEASNLAIRKEPSSTAKALKELEDLVRGQKKASTFKGSGYEVGDEKLSFKI